MSHPIHHHHLKGPKKNQKSSGRANYAYIFHVFRPYRKSDNCELLSPVLSFPPISDSLLPIHTLPILFPTSSILTIPSNEPVNTAKRRKAGKKKGDAPNKSPHRDLSRLIFLFSLLSLYHFQFRTNNCYS